VRETEREMCPRSSEISSLGDSVTGDVNKKGLRVTWEGVRFENLECSVAAEYVCRDVQQVI
jgi:hypothetical protein